MHGRSYYVGVENGWSFDTVGVRPWIPGHSLSYEVGSIPRAIEIMLRIVHIQKLITLHRNVQLRK